MLQTDEGAEAGQLGDIASNEITDFIVLIDVCPWILPELLDADGDALVGFIDFEHDGFYFVPFLEDLRGVIDFAGPGDVGNVDHAVEAFFELDEGAVTGKIANLALDARAGRIFLLA